MHNSMNLTLGKPTETFKAYHHLGMKASQLRALNMNDELNSISQNQENIELANSNAKNQNL